MKTKSFLFAALAVVGLFFTNCSNDDDKDDDPGIEVTGITIDSDSLEIEVGSTATLVATLTPDGATGDITWTSSSSEVAAVNGGVVTALSVGETTIVASYGTFNVSCEVTVEPVPVPLDPTLEGSNYTVIQLDETSFTAIESSVINDLRPDETENSKNLFVWSDTFTAGTTSGLNYYGQSEGWVSLVVASAGWSGAGYNVGTDAPLVDLTDMYDNPDDYYFHIGFKSAETTSSYLLIFGDGTSEAKICIGPSTYTDSGVDYAPYADFTRDNEWQTVEIPVTKLNELGVYYNSTFNDSNVFSFLAGGTAGTTLDFDAVFFYKKAE